jgi:fido (protein-threonine AMPylation protein)
MCLLAEIINTDASLVENILHFGGKWVTEVHPFIDGNGRVARIMMNSELIHTGLCRIIVPTVFRDDYLLALRALSRSNNTAPLVKAIDFAQDFSSKIDYSSYIAASRFLESCHAFNEPESDVRLILPGASSVTSPRR